MSVVTLDFLHSFAYTNTVSIPVSKNTHHAQFPLTPFCLTISVTKLGVSVENVVATMDTPSNHQGIFRPDKKYSAELFPDCLDTHIPINNVIESMATTIAQSNVDKVMFEIFNKIRKDSGIEPFTAQNLIFCLKLWITKITVIL